MEVSETRERTRILTNLLDSDDLFRVIVHAFVDSAERAGAELLEDGILASRVIARDHGYRRRT